MTDPNSYPVGTPVAIEYRGRIYQGVVAYHPARNYGTSDDPDWFFQYRSPDISNPRNHSDGGLGYCKQKEDGVTVVDFPSTDDINPPHRDRA